MSGLARAFTLITVRPGSEEKVIEVIRGIEGVKRVYRVCGPYDIIAEIETEELSALREIVENKIRKIPESRSSLTMIVLEG
ncbi:MAG: Lrp/AsnC family transcriptional regulator [Candidatus Hecatellales archaeon]|nr:MAG: Lrp/AsnC family transcriptional regulator [Candidatus Hecatellales archaeon]